MDTKLGYLPKNMLPARILIVLCLRGSGDSVYLLSVHPKQWVSSIVSTRSIEIIWTVFSGGLHSKMYVVKSFGTVERCFVGSLWLILA